MPQKTVPQKSFPSRLPLYALCFILTCCLCATPIFASYALDVPLSVSATADSAEEAKRSALGDGERKAFFAALYQLAPDQARDIYRKLRGKDVAPYLDSFTITRELERAGRYEADVIYRVNKEELMRFIQADKGIVAQVNNDAPPQGNGLLIIPAYDAGGELLMWEGQNLWRTVLNNVALEVGQGDLVMPFGDPRDISMLDDQTILTGDKRVLAQTATRYGTRNVVIALARSRLVADTPVVEVILRKAGAKKGDELIRQYKARNELETLEVLLNRAARDISEHLKESIEDFSLFGVSEANKLKPLVMRAEYRTAKQWREIQNMLETLPAVEQVNIGSVSIDRAQVTLLYKGSNTMISRALTTQGYAVNTDNAYWIITPEAR